MLGSRSETDLFQRDFTAAEPGRQYMGDITYLPLADGRFLYPATVLDCFSRKVVGWSIAGHMRTSLVTDALRMAARTRGGLDGSVFHSATELNTGPGLSQTSATTSVSPGPWARSAPARTTRPAKASTRPSNTRLSTAPATTATPPTCRNRVLAWLTRYNTRRQHSANSHLSPNEYEHRHHAAKLTLAARPTNTCPPSQGKARSSTPCTGRRPGRPNRGTPPSLKHCTRQNAPMDIEQHNLGRFQAIRIS
ncbi:DDE-type integrase/transposase/recombinase [Streptomyces cinereoruber]|uniref:DDE-type integrase/transposase/recombinase n=1 Tax=Streptomyces cinereoruber TaxID=67260 RepID=UPI00363D22C1